MENDNNTTKKVTKRRTKKKTAPSTSVEVDAKDKIDKLERVIFALEGDFIHVKVGDANQPADDDDVEKIQGRLVELLERYKVNALAFVTHHAVEIDIYNGQNKED